MAKAYLGKISALVTANTSDFNSKLNASANELRSFAKSVQGNITRATQDANRAFTSILTPLQKFEASLKAASSMRLSFKGFQGAINDINELKARLATLKDSQVNLVVNASGMKSLTDFRNAIANISSKEINLVTRVGGLEQLKQLRQETADISNKEIRIFTEVGGLEKMRELREIIDTEDGRRIATSVQVDAETLDATIEKFNRFDNKRASAAVAVAGAKDIDAIIAKFDRVDNRQIDAVIRVLGEADLDAALTKARQLYSAAELIAKPLGEAQSQFSRLSLDVQAAFIPALNKAQDAAQQLRSDIESGAEIGQSRFAALEKTVALTAAAIERLAAVSSKLQGIDFSGTSFADPQIIDLLNRFAEAQKRATEIPGVARSGDQFTKLAADVQAASRGIEVLIARQEAASDAGDRSRIQLEINAETQGLERLIKEYELLSSARSQAAKNLGISANAQGFDTGVLTETSTLARQAEKDINSLLAGFQKFIDTQREAGSSLPQQIFRPDDLSGFSERARFEADRAKKRLDSLGQQLQRRQLIELAVQVTGADSIETLRNAAAAFAGELKGIGQIDALTDQERAALRLSKVMKGILESGKGVSFLLSDGKLLQKSIGGLFKELGGPVPEFGKTLASALQQGLLSIKGTQDELNNLIISLSTAKDVSDLQLDQKIRISPAQLENLANLEELLSPIIRQANDLQRIGRERIELAIKVTGAKDIDELRRVLGGQEFDASSIAGAAVNRSADSLAKDLGQAAAASAQSLKDLENQRAAAVGVLSQIGASADAVGTAAASAFKPYSSATGSAISETESLTEALQKLESELKSSGFPGNLPKLEPGDFDSFAQSVRDLYERIGRLKNELFSDAQAVVNENRRSGESLVGASDPQKTAERIAQKAAERRKAIVEGLLQDIARVQSQAEARTAEINAPKIRADEAEKAILEVAAAFQKVNDVAGANSGQTLFDRLAADAQSARRELDKLGNVPGVDQLTSQLNGVTQGSDNFGKNLVASRESLIAKLRDTNQQIAELEQERGRLQEEAVNNQTGPYSFDLTGGAGSLSPQDSGATDFKTSQLDQLAAKLEDLRSQAAAYTAELEKKPDDAAVKAFLESQLAQTQNIIDQTGRLKSLQGNPTGPFGPELPPGFGGRSDAGLGPALDDPQRQVEQLRSSIGGLKGQLDSLPASVRSSFIPAIQAAEAEFTRLAALGPAATRAELSQASREVDRLTQALNRARQAASIPSFRQFTQGLSTRQAVGELQALQQILARVGAEAAGPAARAYDRYAAAVRRAAREGTTGLPATRQELERLQVAAAQAAAATGRISFRGALREIRRGGDIGRGGFDKFSLALNQAAFAIDDFFSATGGLEFKIRAVSNNVTQLAFILGGTAGLFAGLAAVIGGQLLIAYDKFFLKSDEAKRRLEAMNEALSRQKTLAEELSQAYRALADSIERSAMSRAASQTREREQEVGGIRERQRERRGRLVAELDGRVGQREAIIAELEEKLGTEIDRFKRQAIQAQIRKLRADIEGITQAAERGADRQIDRATRQSQFTGRTRVAELRRGREDADRDLREAQLALGDNAPDNAVFRGRTLGQYREALIEFDVALQKLADNAATAALELNSQQARRAAAAQSRLEGAFGDQPSRISSTLDFAASLRRQFFEELQKGNASEEAFADFSAEISKVERVLIQAADAASRFADVLDRQVASLARAVEGDLVSAEGNARRTANRLESQFGPNDPRVVEARDNEQRLTRERQRAERERQRIDQEIEGQRARYEDELLDGRGSPADVERARRIRELDSQANSLVLTEENRRAARQEADRLRLEQQQAFESRPDIQRLRRRADEGDIEAQRELQRKESAERGRRYSMTPAQRAGEELDQQVADIREYFSQAAENSTGLPEDVAKIRNRMNEAIARAEEDFMRQIAPVTMGLMDSVQNAVLQGPSRAALNVSDATTMEGARELNRLLRGDDEAKNVDLVALQKEANAILERIAQKQNPVAN
jgi:hypothetical protein